MDTNQAIKELAELSTFDKEESHMKADEILLEVLKNNGFSDVVEAYKSARENIEFYYH